MNHFSMTAASQMPTPPALPVPGPVHPIEMQSARRWLLYALEERRKPDGAIHLAKVPRYIDGTRRRGDLSNDGDQLVTYAEACAALGLHPPGSMAGLGFALGDGWQGIDFDKTNVRPELNAQVAQLPGYVERSPSGTGYHAIGYGAAFRTLSSNASGIEAYCEGRFFTFTGDVVRSGPLTDLRRYVDEVLAPLHAAGQKVREMQPGPVQALTGQREIDEIADALRYLDADDRGTWIKVGQALYTLGEPGRALWSAWSASSSRFPGGDDLERFETFSGSRTSYKSILKQAAGSGWTNPRARRAKSIASAFAGQVATPGTVAANAAVLGPMPVPPAPPVPAVPVADAFPLDPVLSEDALALMFVSQCGAQFRHTPGMGWMRNDGPNWTRDDELRRLSQVRKLLRQVGASTGDDRVRLRVESAKTAAAVISFAASDERIAVPAAAWDADPAVLNTPAGIVDLRTGQIRPHAGELHTQVTRVSPDSTGPREAFDGFMRAVFMGDAAMVEFMQRLLGYFATGDRREQKLFFAYGLGANGKSTLFDLVLWLLGTYGLKLPSNVLMQSGMERHPTELAQLQGRRLALSSELDAGQFWAESRIKELTGDETLRGRFMRQDYFEFPMTQKHLIVGNYKPRLRGGDQALGRRFVLVPFDAKFTEAQRDVLMAEKLRVEAPAVLAWVIEGAAKWYDSGLQIPARVIEASAEYLAEHDDIASWLDECCDVGPGHRARARDLYASFSIWIRARGQAAPSQTFWGGQLSNVPGITKRQSNGPIYEGVRVRSVVEFGQVGGVGGVTSLSTPHAHTYGVHIGGTPPTPPTA